MTPARGPPRFHTEDELINGRRDREDVKAGLRTVLMRQEGHTGWTKDDTDADLIRFGCQGECGTGTLRTLALLCGHTQDTNGH